MAAGDTSFDEISDSFLSEPVQLDAYPTIAPLPAGETPRWVGYGGTESGGPEEQWESSGVRKNSALKILNVSDLGYRGAGADGGICWGDSGGPLLSEDGRFIYGVTSRHAGQEPECTIGGQGTWVNLSSEHAAIEQAIRDDDGGVGYLNAKFRHLGVSDTTAPTAPTGCQSTPHLAGFGLLASWLLMRRRAAADSGHASQQHAQQALEVFNVHPVTGRQHVDRDAARVSSCERRGPRAFVVVVDPRAFTDDQVKGGA